MKTNEIADHDLVSLGAELTRLRAERLANQGKRDALGAVVREGLALQDKLVATANQGQASLDAERRVLDVKINTVRQLILNDVSPLIKSIDCCGSIPN